MALIARSVQIGNRIIVDLVLNPDDPEFLGQSDTSDQLTEVTDREVKSIGPGGEFIWGDTPERRWGNEFGALVNQRKRQLVVDLAEDETIESIDLRSLIVALADEQPPPEIDLGLEGETV